jgi:hypothetical protein
MARAPRVSMARRELFERTDVVVEAVRLLSAAG